MRGAQLAHVLRLARISGFVYNVAADTFEWSEALRVIHGAGLAATSMAQTLSFYDEPERQRLAELYAAAVQDGLPFEFEGSRRIADGSSIAVRLAVEPELERGRVVQLVGVLQDISAERARLRSAQDALNQLYSLSESIPEAGMFQLRHRRGRDFIFSFTSAGLRRVVDVEVRKGDAAERFESFVIEADRPRLRAAVREMLRSLSTSDMECRVKRLDGQVRSVLIRSRARRDDEGETTYLEGVILDIHDRRRAEENVHERDQMLSAIDDQLRTGSIYTLVIPKLGNPYYTYLSRSLRNLLGLPSTLHNVPFDQALVMLDENELSRLRSTRSSGTSNGAMEFLTRRTLPNGEVRWIMHRAAQRVLTGDAVAWDGIASDVTDQQLAREQRERLITRLEQQNAELERFNYAVSHDLKSALVGIQGLIDLGIRFMEEGKAELARTRLEQGRRVVKRMWNVLLALLDLSREGRSELRARDMPLMPIIDVVRELLVARIEETGAKIELSPANPRIYGDGPRLQQIFLNLIDNALKYRRHDIAPHVRIRVERFGVLDHIAVEDNGCGVRPEHRERIFTAFERLDRTIDGTGLGLALVRKIVERHEGTIHAADSALGGLAVLIDLPHPPTGTLV